MSSEPQVYVVDDDADMRLSLRWLIESIGVSVETFPSAETFLAQDPLTREGCLILDVRMPGMGGILLLEHLKNLGSTLPVIMFTGHGEVPMAVQTLKYGAFDFLEKPASHQIILDRVQAALALDRRVRLKLAEKTDMEQRIQQLTPREKEILTRLIEGHSTREMALSLEISDRTVEKHRERMIVKLGAKNQLDLVRRAVEHRNGD
jgi:two-component system, LuxR family, response regulator FixJ